MIMEQTPRAKARFLSPSKRSFPSPTKTSRSASRRRVPRAGRLGRVEMLASLGPFFSGSPGFFPGPESPESSFRGFNCSMRSSKYSWKESNSRKSLLLLTVGFWWNDKTPESACLTTPENLHGYYQTWEEAPFGKSMVLSRLSAVKTQVFTVGFHGKSIGSDLQSGCQEQWHTYQAADWLGSRVVLLEIGHAPDRNLCRIVENPDEVKYKSNCVGRTGGVIFSVRASAVDAHCIDIQACPANVICHVIHCSETLCDLVGFLWADLCSMNIHSTRYLRWRSVGSQVCQTCA